MYITRNDFTKRSYNNESYMGQKEHLYKRKAIAITRVSTQNQCDSLEAQLEIIRNYCAKHPELELIEEPYELKESAYCLKPKELDSIIENVADGCAIIISRIDRLTRNKEDYPIFKEKICKHNIEFHFVQEGIIWNKDSDRKTSSTVFKGIDKAEDESDNTSDRTRRNMAYARSKGKFVNRPVFGYINYTFGDNKGFMPHPVWSKYVKDLFSMYSTGNYSIQEVVDFLNKKYQNKKYQKQLEKFPSKKYPLPITKQRASGILNNPFFIGKARHEDVHYKHIYEAFISKKLFDKCKKISNQKRPRNIIKKETASPLYHIVRDEKTNYLLTPDPKKGHIYMKSNPAVEAPLPNGATIIDGIHKALRTLSVTEELKELLYTQINETNLAEINSISIKIKNHQNNIDVLNKRAANTLSNYGASDQQITNAVSIINKQIQTYQDFLAEYKEQKKQLQNTQVAISDDLVKTFDAMSIANQHKMLTILFSDIKSSPKTLKYNFHQHIRKTPFVYIIPQKSK